MPPHLKGGSFSIHRPGRPSASDPQDGLCCPNFLILNLKGHVFDLELFVQDDLGSPQDRRCVFHVPHDEMSGQRIRP